MTEEQIKLLGKLRDDLSVEGATRLTDALTAAISELRDVGEMLTQTMKIEIGIDPLERWSLYRNLDGTWETADDEYDSALDAWREVKKGGIDG